MSNTTTYCAAPTAGLTANQIPSFAVLRPDLQPLDPRRPFAHQREAWARLSAHLEESRSTGVFESVMVMPTGGGKTYTSATWLMAEIINNGGRVLWIAHRDDLLEQAAADFHRAAALAGRRGHVKVRIVSGRHCKAGTIDPSDDVVVVSVATLARHPEVVGGLLDDPRLFMVVDEFQHAVAPTYRAVIDRLRAMPRRRLLGLTATPTRTVLHERPVLAALFGNRNVYEVGPAELIERGILARPDFIQASTRSTIDRGLTPADRDYLRRYGDISPAWLDRIARIEGRNHAIIDLYLRHRARFGQTLIFAISVAHAVLLTDRMRALGVAADYVACTRHDGKGNRQVLDRFRDAGGGLEVLVSVDLLTEGADIPAVRTVMLARPTLSEILLQQMIGRALRGPAVGGTDLAFVVSFDDRWRRADEWRGALDRVQALYAPAVTTRPGLGRDRTGGTMPAWETITAVAPQVRALVPAGPIESSESVAERWYVTGGVGGAQRGCRVIVAYTHQRDAYDAAMGHLERLPAEGLAAVDATTLAAGFFVTGPASPPPLRDLGLLLDHFRAQGRRPECYRIEDRLACDPRTVARLVRDDDMGERARTELLRVRYTPLAQAIYPTLRDYRAAVDDALYTSRYPEAANPARPVFEPPTGRECGQRGGPAVPRGSAPRSEGLTPSRG